MSITCNLKPTNRSSISGCPGVPKTFPHFNSILEIRQTEINQIFINSISIKFITIDSLKFNKNNTPNSVSKVNFELNFNINSKIISIDLPFSIPINSEISQTLESNLFKVNHYLSVELILLNKQSKVFEFPIVINKYDNLPIYRQFNQPISKILDSKDSLFFLEYSLPCSSIGPNEFLQLNLKVNKSISGKSLKLKKIYFDIVEIFDCRCDNSFIKENVIKSEEFEINKDIETSFEKDFNINLNNNSINQYLLLNKLKNPKLLTASNTNKSNQLKPIIIDFNSKNPVPLISHNNYQTFKSNFFQVYYQLNIKIKYNKTRSIEFKQPFTISNHNRFESMELIKWIINESKKVNENDFIYDPKFDVFKKRNFDKMTVMRNKDDKESFM